MLKIIPEQVSTNKEHSVWVVDLKDNNIPKDTQSIKTILLNKHIEYLVLDFIIDGIEFFKNVNEKIVLLCKEI